MFNINPDKLDPQNWDLLKKFYYMALLDAKQKDVNKFYRNISDMIKAGLDLAKKYRHEGLDEDCELILKSTQEMIQNLDKTLKAMPQKLNLNINSLQTKQRDYSQSLGYTDQDLVLNPKTQKSEKVNYVDLMGNVFFDIMHNDLSKIEESFCSFSDLKKYYKIIDLKPWEVTKYLLSNNIVKVNAAKTVLAKLSD